MSDALTVISVITIIGGAFYIVARARSKRMFAKYVRGVSAKSGGQDE